MFLLTFLLSRFDWEWIQPSLPDYERVLYAALAPSPQTRAILLSACRTWEDHLWAQISIACEEKESSEMLKLGGSFWEGGLPAIEKGVMALSEEEMEAEEDEWTKEVTSALDTLKTIDVAEGCVTWVALECMGTYVGRCTGQQLTMLSTSPSSKSYWTGRAPCWTYLLLGCSTGRIRLHLLSAHECFFASDPS